MPGDISHPPPAIEATYKGRDVEGIADLYFYRKIGFWLARLCARLQLTPTAVTLIGGAFGIIAGHLYYYSDLFTNLSGLGFHVVANVFDNADGQLARLTNRKSRTGRLLDGFVDHLIFLGIYLHLALRCRAEGASLAIWLLVLAAAISHALQAAAADYCRNAYLFFTGKNREFDSASSIAADYQPLRWRDEPVKKFFLALYLSATREQEMLLPTMRRLRAAIADNLPSWLQSSYRDSQRPMFRWWGLLMTNTRMVFLFAIFLIHQPAWYFWIELTVLNILLVALLIQQERACRSLLARVSA
ncbi:MAG: CDP-alcohol phosphatidyltransferase family protein [Spartobacteria bacterium]